MVGIIYNFKAKERKKKKITTFTYFRQTIIYDSSKKCIHTTFLIIMLQYTCWCPFFQYTSLKHIKTSTTTTKKSSLET